MNLFKEYALENFRGLVDAMVPRTPELSDERGSEHEPGAVDVDLQEYMVNAFNNFLGIPETGRLSVLSEYGIDRVPLAPLVAFLLDCAAWELVLRGRNTGNVSLLTGDGLQIFGLYTSLSEQDRLNAVSLLEDDTGYIKTVFDTFSTIIPQAGMYEFIVAALGTFPPLAYYSEWSGYESKNEYTVPDSESFNGAVQSWKQSGFPGPADGYDDHRGYEIEEYRENEYQ